MAQLTPICQLASQSLKLWLVLIKTFFLLDFSNKILIILTLKFNNSVIMCKAISTTPAIETYFNYDHYPAVVNDQDRSVGLQDQSVRIKDASIDCFVRRQIKMDSISDQFYNLNNDFYLLVAKGPLNGKKYIL
jgi:hypothetical protein